MAIAQGAAAGKAGKGGRKKLIAVLAIGLLIIVAVQIGLVGYGYARLKSALFPRDEGLLEFLPGDTGGVLILDPHRIDPHSIGDEKSTARIALDRVREDVKKVAGIDLYVDVDKLALAPGIAVARGRFSRSTLEARLLESRYVGAEHQGTPYLVRKGEDAVALVGDVLLYGDEASIHSAIDAADGDTSLAENKDVTRRLSEIGWDHGALLTIRMSDERPSLRAVLTGFTGPRAVSASIDAKGGTLDVHVSVETASASAADELAKLLEEKRGNAETLRSTLSAEAAQVLVDVAKAATIKAAPGLGAVDIRLRLDAATQERLVRVAANAVPANAGDIYKSLRLYQLLMPGL